MNKKFSTEWKKSKSIAKQRKYAMNAPLHIKGNFLRSTFSKELREKYAKRNFGVRKGDKVTVLRGNFKGKSGKVENVSLRERKLFISGVESIKKDGSKSMYPINPSNVKIIELNLDDKKRKEVLMRK